MACLLYSFRNARPAPPASERAAMTLDSVQEAWRSGGSGTCWEYRFPPPSPTSLERRRQRYGTYGP
jgi:hypothetical protein